MHKQIIEHLDAERLKLFITDFITMLKTRDPSLYEEAEICLYKYTYGCHFNEWSLEKALAHMSNEDGSTGGYWTVDQTTQVAKDKGLSFTNFNQYDWNYVMNMVYSDYYGAISNDVDAYFKIAKKFILDKDAPEGKAFKYYLAMK